MTCFLRYENQQIALNCGIMLRDSIRFVEHAKLILNSDEFYKFFNYVETSTFDIASDAFATFKVKSKTLIQESFCLDIFLVFPKNQPPCS